MFKFGEGTLENEIKDTEMSFSEVPMFNSDIFLKKQWRFGINNSNLCQRYP